MKNDQTQLVLDILSSKWATRIVKVLDDDTKRFSEIQKALPDTKQKVLTETLTTSFVQMLSEARKYKLFLTLAEQSTSQQSDQQMVSIIMANVGTVITFRTGNPQDERVLLSPQ